MPTREGAEHVIEEILAGMPEPEVLITDADAIQHGDENAGEEIASEPAADRASVAFGGDRTGWPLIRDPHWRDGKTFVAGVPLDPAADRFLTQHRLRDKPLLPLVIQLEAMAEAAACLAPDRRITAFVDVSSAAWLHFPSAKPLEARIETTPCDRRVACRFVSDFHNRQGQLVIRDRLHATATVETGDPPQTLSDPRPALPPEMRETVFQDQQAALFRGTALQCVRQVELEENGGVGLIDVPPITEIGGPNRPGRWIFHPAVLDACFCACGMHARRMDEQSVPLPWGVARLRLGCEPRVGERCVLWFRFRGNERSGDSPPHSIYDITLWNEGGSIVVVVEGYRSLLLPERLL
jgi:hypothetical protein